MSIYAHWQPVTILKISTSVARPNLLIAIVQCDRKAVLIPSGVTSLITNIRDSTEQQIPSLCFKDFVFRETTDPEMFCSKTIKSDRAFGLVTGLK